MQFKEFNEIDFRMGSSLNKKNILERLPENEKKRIMKEYFWYRKLFTLYIAKKIGLKKYDEMMKQCELNFRTIDDKNMDFFQYFSRSDLRYFYIRNNIHIERLSDEERRFVDKRAVDNNYELDDEASEFIRNTYDKVIFEDVLNNGKQCIVMYGPNSANYFANNDAVIIGFRYNEFPNNEVNSSSWNEKYQKKLIFLKDFLSKMQHEINQKVEKEIKILRYNDFSIDKRNEEILEGVVNEDNNAKKDELEL